MNQVICACPGYGSICDTLPGYGNCFINFVLVIDFHIENWDEDFPYRLETRYGNHSNSARTPVSGGWA